MTEGFETLLWNNTITFQEEGPSTLVYVISFTGFLTQIASIIGGFFVLAAGFILNFHKEHFGRMLLAVTAVSLIHSVPLKVFAAGPKLCTFAGALDSYTIISSCIWGVCLCSQLYLVVYKKEFSRKKLSCFYFFASLVIPILVAILGGINNYYTWWVDEDDPEDTDCAHLETDAFDSSLFFIIALPNLCLAIAMLIIWGLCFKEFDSIKESYRTPSAESFRILIWLCAMIPILWIPQILVTLLVSATVDVSDLLVAIFYYLPYAQGLLIAIVVGSSSKFRRGLKQFEWAGAQKTAVRPTGNNPLGMSLVVHENQKLDETEAMRLL